ncbi:MAG: phosphatase PAP2 family protein [Bacteroidota bacterium]
MFLEPLIQLDEQLFVFLNGLGTPVWDGFWLFMTKTRNSFPLYLLLLVLSYRFFGGKGTLVILVAVALLITCTDQLSNFFKYGVQRLRPCHDPDISGAMRLVKSYCGGQYAFFSAHAANSFAAASFFTALFVKKWPWFTGLLLLWAVIVAYSRIYIGVHFPLDVIVGALIGSLFGWVFAKLYIFALHKIGA